ncbi:MAG: hypothetical protein KHZ99_10245 [Clostridium sp.]|uniref:hypothetical protein n=1 Tax=Clostridium sp. TaxID=1506 RepID=UPI0025B7E8C7|nr:hypothetical protein [Clostridium sp.]MBS4957410.1 hypothetical protein [Clostridium sp.]
MKKIFKIFIVAFLFLNIPIIYVHSETLNLIEEKLESIGVPEEYGDNIINYITNLKLTDEETKELLEEANNIFFRVKEKDDYSDFTLTELLNIYGEALNIADELNINLDLDLSSKEVVLKDKDSKLTLIKCDIDDVKRYYENYKVSPLTSQDYEELKSYIVENTITNDEKINSSESSNDIAKSDDYGNSDLSDDEVSKESKKSNSSDSNESNNETLNTVSAIKNKNVNRVLSIVFLVLFACVVVSLLIESIFFNKEEEW